MQEHEEIQAQRMNSRTSLLWCIAEWLHGWQSGDVPVNMHPSSTLWVRVCTAYILHEQQRLSLLPTGVSCVFRKDPGIERDKRWGSVDQKQRPLSAAHDDTTAISPQRAPRRHCHSRPRSVWAPQRLQLGTLHRLASGFPPSTHAPPAVSPCRARENNRKMSSRRVVSWLLCPCVCRSLCVERGRTQESQVHQKECCSPRAQPWINAGTRARNFPSRCPPCYALIG